MPNPYPAKLFYEEIFWRDRYHFFRKKGYILRPRYHPEWQASWRFEANPILELFEDSIFQWVSVFLYPLVRVSNSYNGYQKGELLDATEAREDGKNVFINSRTHPKEVKIASRLGYTENQKDKRNHCVPMLAIFSDDRDPWHQYIVMPVLRPFNKPNFTSVGEVVDFVDQTLEWSLSAVDRRPTISQSHGVTRLPSFPGQVFISCGMSPLISIPVPSSLSACLSNCALCMDTLPQRFDWKDSFLVIIVQWAKTSQTHLVTNDGNV